VSVGQRRSSRLHSGGLSEIRIDEGGGEKKGGLERNRRLFVLWEG
jgi:hypothetical protein